MKKGERIRLLRKNVSAIMLSLLVISTLTSAFKIQPVKAAGTIYIRADGSIDPLTAPISTVDNITYAFTSNINESIVVERDDITIDGNGYTVTGDGSWKGIDLSYRSNVTIKNVKVKSFVVGLMLFQSCYCTITHVEASNNVASGNYWSAGIGLFGSYNNSIAYNVVLRNDEAGIILRDSFNNAIVGNMIVDNFGGIWLKDTENGGNLIIGNLILRNYYGIYFGGIEGYIYNHNKIYHNNLEKNRYQLNGSINAEWNDWDNSYPSGGNYWSDYDGMDLYSGPYQNIMGGDGIGDTPYMHPVYDTPLDRYPLMHPFYPYSTTKYPWPKFQNDLANTGFTLSPSPNTNTTRWTYQAGIIWTAPAVDEGKVVFGDYNNTFYALDARYGSLVWKFETNGLITSSPAICNGKVYFGSYDGNVYCLNLTTGLEIWNYSLSYPIIAGPTVVNGSVYVPTGGYLWAFDADNGSLIWSYQLSPVGTSDSTPAYSNGKLIFGASNNYVYAVNATDGSLIWRYLASDPGQTSSMWGSPTVSTGRVFIGSNDMRLHAINETTGMRLWTTTTNAYIQSTPSVAYGLVYVGSLDYNLYAINATTGAIIWTFETNGEIYFAPAIADGKVFFGSWDGDFYALNATTGEVVWKYQSTAPEEGFIGMGSAIADGVLYVGTYGNYSRRTQRYGRLIAFSTMWTVDDDGPADFHTIQEAINAANPGDTIYVHNGTYYENVIVNKTVSLVGEDVENTIVDGSGITTVFNVMAYNVVIRGFTIRNSFGPSIHIHQNANATVQNNYITNGLGGIHLDNSSGNYIADNTITNLTDIGIWLDVSGGNTLRNNNMTNNQYDFGVWGESLQHYMNDIDASNTVDGRPIHYWVNRQNEQIPLDAGYVQLVNCTNITVKDLNLTDNLFSVFLAFTNNSLITNNIITNNDVGVEVFYSSNNFISGNNVTNNWSGIFLEYYSNNNCISENNIANNRVGIYSVYYPLNNLVYHNNFVNNAFGQVYSEGSVNVWDDGYPSGGNYWSDYNGTDLFSGLWQNETGSDGIGDTPYIIDADNRDNYPLMGPWTIEGENVTVTPSSDVAITFKNITSGGITTLNTSMTGPEPPSGFKLATETPTYYDIKTTANYSGPIQIRIAYNDTGLTQDQENNLRLMHWNETIQQWIDITTCLDTESNVIYGETVHLSMFAIMTPTVLIHDISIINITFSNQHPKINEVITIYITLKNNGHYTETFNASVNYTLILDPLIGTQTITLAPRESITLNFTWTPNATGRYEIKAYTSTIPNDTNPSDNTKITYLYVSATYTATFSTEENDWADMYVRGGRFRYMAYPV